MSSGLLVPRHMRTPGDDGYRTPTIEDAERITSMFGGEDRQTAVRDAHTSGLESVLQKASSRATDPFKQESSQCAEPNGHFDRAGTEFPLNWKKRIRHITWAYFTLTMATGGLANVLYEGKYEF